MFEEESDEKKIVVCGVCGTEIPDKALCYEIRYGTIYNGKFQRQEPYMIVHSHCLKE